VNEDVPNGEDDAGEDAKAEAGAGDPPEPRPSPTPKRKKRPSRRGNVEPDPSLQKLVKAVGRNKLVPDRSAQEIYYSRSIAIRRLVAEYLDANVGSVWTDYAELAARAANYAGCSSVTAARWIRQFTSVEAPFRLLDGVDHFVLERRE